MNSKLNLKCLKTFMIFLLLIFIISSKKSFPFQKIVWAFWHTQIQQAPLIVQLCHQKIQIIAKNNGFQFIYLHSHNLRQYISTYDTEFLTVLTNSQRKSEQADSDLIRITIIQEHGGIYFDISTIIFNNYNLEWLSNLDDFHNVIINKYSNTPQVLLFTYCDYQSSMIQRSREGFLVNDNPGFQIWFIAAKKNAQLMIDWKKNYYNFTQIGVYAYNKLLSDENIFIRNVDNSGSYWSANIALYYTLQIKQRQLDQKITLNTLFIPRVSVYEYYKTWGIQGQHGPLVFTRSDLIKQNNIFEETIQQLQNRTGELKFFLKMNSIFRKSINHDLIELSKLYKKGNFDFDQYLRNQPHSQDCNRVKFIVQDSLFDKEFVSHSNIVRQLNINSITIDQRQKWRNYCSEYVSKNLQQPKISDIFLKDFPIGSYAKIQEIQNWKPNLTLSQKFIQFIQYNRFIFQYIIYFMVLISVFFFSISFAYNFTYKIYSECDLTIKQNRKIQISQINPQIVKQFASKPLQRLFFLFIRFIQLVLGIILFYCLQVFNYTPLTLQTFLYLISAILIQKVINKKQIINEGYFCGISAQKLFLVFDIPINYFICYSVLQTIEKRSQYIISHSIIISLIGSSLYSIAKNLHIKNKSVNKLLQTLLSHQDYHKLIVLIFYSVILLIPNLKFYICQSGYLIQYFVYVPLTYVSILLVAVFYELSKQQMKQQIYSKTKVIFIFLLGAYLLSSFVFYKVLFVKSWQTRKYQLSLICAFTYIYLLSNSEIQQSKNKKMSQILLNRQGILKYGFLLYYLLLGSFSFNYQIFQYIYLLEALTFVINIGIYLALDEIFTDKKQIMYEKLAKIQEIQISSLPI